ncbi:mechanosensitive ion channel family protein [Myxococcota bacterium]|nr:mechanosensitive ion channel family protein [Myxococcota bacterium]
MPAWMETLWGKVLPLLEHPLAHKLGMALLLVAVGLPLARLVSRTLGVVAVRFTGAARARVVASFSWYALVFVVVTSALNQAGFDLSVLLGAAGILTVALGFASQTSASNVISGLFLVAERPFEPGDVIEIDGLVGEVLDIDLMSVKLRTFDNLFVRLPNETLIKARITNLTRFPIRRIDVPLGVSYDSDLSHVRRVLEQVAEEEPLVLEEPPTVFLVKAFGDSAVELVFSCWAAGGDYLPARAAVFERILEAFRAEGIEIPFPQRVILHRDERPVSGD